MTDSIIGDTNAWFVFAPCCRRFYANNTVRRLCCENGFFLRKGGRDKQWLVRAAAAPHMCVTHGACVRACVSADERERGSVVEGRRAARVPILHRANAQYARARARSLLDALSFAAPETFITDQETLMSWHYHDAEIEFGKQQVTWGSVHLQSLLTRRH